MTDLWHDVSPGEPEKLNVIIEIPAGSRNKYELDKDTGLIILDRVLYSPFHYPANYGFVPQSYWEDGDPLDVFVMTYDPLISGCIVEARPIGVLRMIDSGEPDEKILAVPVEDPRFKDIKELSDIPEHFLKEISHFFEHYKDLQGKKVDVQGWEGRESALQMVEKGFKLYKKKFGKK